MRSRMRLLGAIGLVVIVALLMIGMGAVGAGNGDDVALSPGDLEFETVQVHACEDTTLNSWYPQNNYGSSTTLTLRSQNGSSPILKFDLASLLYPQDMAVASARLKIYVQSSSNALQAWVSAYAVNRPWVANEATWYRANSLTVWDEYGCNGVPVDRAETGTSEVYLSESGTWLTLDITDLVRRWLLGTLDNNGLLLKATARGSVGYTLFSADYTNGAYRPYIEIDYLLIPTPTPTVTPTATPRVPVLEVDKVGPVGPLKPSERTITYNITVRNTGTALASGIVITDVLPLGTSFSSCTEGGTYVADGHLITWQGIDLDEDEALTIVVHLDLEDWVEEMGNIVNVARVTCAGCRGVVEDYWETIVIAPSPTPTLTPSPTPTPVLMYLPLEYNERIQ